MPAAERRSLGVSWNAGIRQCGVRADVLGERGVASWLGPAYSPLGGAAVHRQQIDGAPRGAPL